MWKNLSLRMRLLLPLGAMFVAAVLIGGVALQIFAPGQLMDESEPAQRSAKAVAGALNGALATSANPEQTLDAFVQALGTSEAIRFRPTGTGVPPCPAGGPDPARTGAALVRRSDRHAGYRRRVPGDDQGQASWRDRLFARHIRRNIREMDRLSRPRFHRDRPDAADRQPRALHGGFRHQVAAHARRRPDPDANRPL